MNRQNSAQHAKPRKSYCAIEVIEVTCSFSFQGSLVSPGTSQFCQFLPPPLGGGEVLDWNLTQFRTKNPLMHALNEISQIMGFVRIFWKNIVQEAYLPKLSISGQIVSEMLAGYT